MGEKIGAAHQRGVLLLIARSAPRDPPAPGQVALSDGMVSSLRAAISRPYVADIDIAPDRLRLRRISSSWETGEASTTVLASLTTFVMSGYAQPVVTRGKKHLRARIPSRKTGTRQSVEGPGELFLGMDSEVRWDCTDWQAHPWMMTFAYDGRTFEYHLDHMRQFRDGTIQCIEAKRSAKDLADPDYRLKLACVAEICRRVGWRFDILYKADIRGGLHRVRNVEALFGRTYAQVSRNQEEIVQHFRDDAAPVEWGSLRDRLAPASRISGDAVIHHMMTRGFIAADLDSPFVPETPLHPLAPPAAARSMRF